MAHGSTVMATRWLVLSLPPASVHAIGDGFGGKTCCDAESFQEERVGARFWKGRRDTREAKNAIICDHGSMRSYLNPTDEVWVLFVMLHYCRLMKS